MTTEHSQVSVTIPLAADERAAEAALRGRFATYWSTATGTPRANFDSFISATPIADGVSFERIDNDAVHGWWARSTEPSPDGVILHVHGGGYVQGSAEAFRPLASQIVARTQLSTLVLDYPLAPEATVPTALDAVMAAYDWLHEHFATRIAIIGDSAGAGLALALMSQLAQRETQAVAGVLFSPWVDLAFTGASMTDASIADPLITYEHLQDYAHKYLGRADPRDPLASPLYGDLSRLPPLLIQVGTDERLLDDAKQLADRATRAGSTVQLEIWQGMHHVFQLNVADLHTSRRALAHATAFLAEAFARG